MVDEISRRILNEAFSNVMERYPFTLDAICLLPDHLHCIWTLPDGDSDFSIRWSEIKKIFSKVYLKAGNINIEPDRTASRKKRGEASIWQRRFWEHAIRDETDLQEHLDYIHYNPVKHGLVEYVIDWPWSSFHRYVRLGFYEAEWGANASKIGNNLNCGE